MAVAERIGYPVIVRPSFVIGGLAIDFATGAEDLDASWPQRPSVDPIARSGSIATSRAWRSTSTPCADGEQVLVPGLIEHVERAGVHSGDSRRLSTRRRRLRGPQALDRRDDDARSRWRSACAGLVNAQFIVRDDGIYLLEVNPRASRTVPFLSKVTGRAMVDLATRIALGATLAELGRPGGLSSHRLRLGQGPVFSTAKLRAWIPSWDRHAVQGEVIGIHRDPR
jgi:carbamoyl-phosphate synthase large subunit